ncbi:serine hydrolase domain-containing protein [Terricaulis sp.]|uniref:serine hydrolase domain-containing protein n=1 Tax=Terricaulis sp. TaxID=2768686 RepID=UPI003783B0E0
MKFPFWVRAAAFGAAIVATSCQTAAPIAAQPFDAHLAELASRSNAPGVVAAIYRDGRLVEMFAWGAGDCQGNGAIDPHAAFEIGSISKHMTATAVLQLRDVGRLDIESPVGAYLDDIPDAWKRVTLRQLLTHTSGVPDYEEAGGYDVYETSPTPQQVFDIVRDRPLDFEPGTQWSYSNTGYFLLSLVVQRVSGQRFGDYMREHVFAPAGLRHTFESGYAPSGQPITQGCQPAPQGEGWVDVRPISEASTFGAGGILSTLEDWARWDEQLQQGHALSARSMREMFAPVTLPDGVKTGYAFGMEVDDFRGEPRHGHTGQTQGFVADYAHYPERHVSILILANSYHGGTSQLMRALTLRAIPELSYDRLPAATDPDPARTVMVRRAIRQVILLEEPLDLLSEEFLTFARSADSAATRDRLTPIVRDMPRFEFLRSEEPANPGPPWLIFRATSSSGEASYFRARVRDGKLISLRYDEE